MGRSVAAEGVGRRLLECKAAFGLARQGLSLSVPKAPRSRRPLVVKHFVLWRRLIGLKRLNI